MPDVFWGPTHPQYDWALEDFCPDDVDLAARTTHWANLVSWSMHEATALASGYEPDVVLKYLLPHSEIPFTQHFTAKLHLAERYVSTGKLQSPVRPIEYLDWAKEVGITFYPELAEAVRGASKAAVQAVGQDDKPLSPKVRQSLLKIVLGLAVKHHNYNPNRSSASKEIQEVLRNLGLELTDDAIRARLSDAAEEYYHKIEDHLS